VAIVGAPNVGKSTLLNALAGREAAITSEHAGTTRDVIEVRMDLNGLPVTVLDTAGLRDTADAVESIGVDLARRRAAQADMRVFLVEAGEAPEMTPGPGDLVCRAKADTQLGAPDGVSGKTGEGLTALVERITANLSEKAARPGVATRVRHKHAMQAGLEALERSSGLLPMGEDSAELAAEEVRSAIRALDSLVGRIDVENVLDEIFASFCLGK
jgi:tRNA modification GTPase